MLVKEGCQDISNSVVVIGACGQFLQEIYSYNVGGEVLHGQVVARASFHFQYTIFRSQSCLAMCTQHVSTVIHTSASTQLVHRMMHKHLLLLELGSCSEPKQLLLLLVLP